VDYAEGIYVGYRYFDTKNVEPQFPFGFGLSYTKFDYSNLRIAHAMANDTTPAVPVTTVMVDIRNSGSRAGAEIAQLYIHDGHSRIDRPIHELKRFQRVELAPGETTTVVFVLDRAAFSYWSPDKKDWVAEPGKFEVQVGASSRDIRLRAPLTLAPIITN
jgi:beta-glucosidase